MELKLNKDVIDDQDSKPEKDAEWMPNNDVINIEEVKLAKHVDLKPENNPIDDNLAKDGRFSLPKNEVNKAEFLTLKDAEELKFVSDIKEMKSKLNVLESKLNQVNLSLNMSPSHVCPSVKLCEL